MHPAPQIRPPAPQDATRLAVRLIQNYGLSPLGVTSYAPPPDHVGAGTKRGFEVTGAPPGPVLCVLCFTL